MADDNQTTATPGNPGNPAPQSNSPTLMDDPLLAISYPGHPGPDAPQVTDDTQPDVTETPETPGTDDTQVTDDTQPDVTETPETPETPETDEQAQPQHQSAEPDKANPTKKIEQQGYEIAALRKEVAQLVEAIKQGGSGQPNQDQTRQVQQIEGQFDDLINDLPTDDDEFVPVGQLKKIVGNLQNKMVRLVQDQIQNESAVKQQEQQWIAGFESSADLAPALKGKGAQVLAEYRSEIALYRDPTDPAVQQRAYQTALGRVGQATGSDPVVPPSPAPKPDTRIVRPKPSAAGTKVTPRGAAAGRSISEENRPVKDLTEIPYPGDR